MKMEAFSTLGLVLRHGNMALAAREANLTASAVSLQMKQLENYLGQQLFDRSGLQVKALPLAREVAGIMHRAMVDLENLRRPASVEIKGVIRLGVIESMQPLLLPGVLSRLRERYPRLQLMPCRGKSATLTNAVKAGELDAAVVAEPAHSQSSRLRWHCLMTQELSLIVPPTEKETDPDTLFARHEWIRYDRATIAGRLATRYVNHHIATSNSALELDGVRAIVAMVNAGLGISIVQLSEPGICTTFPVRVLRLRQAPVLRFSIVMRAADAEKRLLGVLRDVLEETIAVTGPC